MNKPSSEELMALADGELDAARSRQVAAQIDADPALAREFQVFADTRDPISQLFADRVNETVPQHLVSLIRNYDLKPQPQRTFAPTRSGWLQRLSELLSPSPAVMAGVAGAFVIGLAVGALMSSDAFVPDASENQQLVGWHTPDSPLGTHLEGSAGGSWIAVAQNDPSTTFKGVLSFRKSDGGYCRQYLVRRADAGAIQGVACRGKQRGWTDVIRIAVKAGASGGVKAAAVKDATKQIDSVVDGLIAGDFLGAQDEQRLIKHGWQQK